MNYKDYEISITSNANSWNGVKSAEARKNFDEDTFDYFYLSGVPVGNGRFEPFLNQDEAEATVKEFIDKRSRADIIHEHYHVLISWNKKIERDLSESQSAFESENVDGAIDILNTIGKLKINLDEHWRKSLLGHLNQYRENRSRM